MGVSLSHLLGWSCCQASHAPVDPATCCWLPAAGCRQIRKDVKACRAGWWIHWILKRPFSDAASSAALLGPSRWT
jgi:hypothetical protein